MSAARTGIALSLTVGAGYAACTVLFWLMPESAATFMNSLFHGLDFRRLQAGAAVFGFSGFAYALVGIMLWAFLFGTLFGWLSARIGGRN